MHPKGIHLGHGDGSQARGLGLARLPPQSRAPRSTGEVGGLLLHVPVLALRLAPSAEPVRHMPMSFLPDDGFFVGTPKTPLETCHGVTTDTRTIVRHNRVLCNT
jgi:hypothetical protein